MNMKIDWIAPKKGGNRPKSNGDFSVRIGTSKNAQGLPQSYITLYPKVMKEMRLMSGDRVQVGTIGNCIALRRVNEGGFSLGPTGASKEKRESKLGTPCTSTVKFTSDIVSTGRWFFHNEITITDDGILLLDLSKF